MIMEDILTIDLDNKQTYRSFAHRRLAEGDIKANRFGVKCVRGGRPVSLSGCTCFGSFIRADGATEILTGAIDGDTAYIDLPKACYVVEGEFTMTIGIKHGDDYATLRIIDGSVDRTTSDVIVDPSNLIPDIATLQALLDSINSAIETIEGIQVTAENISGNDYRIIVTRT